MALFEDEDGKMKEETFDGIVCYPFAKESWKCAPMMDGFEEEKLHFFIKEIEIEGTTETFFSSSKHSIDIIGKPNLKCSIHNPMWSGEVLTLKCKGGN